MPVPELRFKGFNDDWEEALLTDIVHFHNGKGHEGVVNENGEYILINSKFISSDRAVFKRVSECHQKVFDDSLVMVMSDVPNGKALAKFIHIVDGKEYALNQRIGMLVFKEEFSSKFYQYPLNRNKYYLAFDSGVGQTNLRKDEVLECPIYKLSLSEQTKIASFLSNVDEKISQLTQKHELLSQYKQGMMQKLFSQQIRFKADDGSEFGEWAITLIKNAVSFIKDGTHGTHQDDPSSNLFLLSAKNLQNGKIVIDEKDRKINQKEFDSIYKNYKLKDGDILLSVVGTIGRVAIFKDYYESYAFQRSVAFMRFKKALPEFIYQLFLAKDFQNELLVRQVVSAQPGIYLGDLSKIEIKLPCLEEQTKIANFLSSIDQKIEVVAQQIEQAKQWKKGLLQQMFV
nr:restriction endonuclease subunit S [Acinetobacter indicus]